MFPFFAIARTLFKFQLNIEIKRRKITTHLI